MEKTTKELKLEKREFNIKIDKKIYDSIQEDGIRTRAREAKRRADRQELEDKGWVGKTFTKKPVIIEPKPEAKPKHKHVHKVEEELPQPESEVDPEKEALKAQLELAKEKLALLDAAKKMEKPEEVEIVPDIEEVTDPDASQA